MAKEQRLVNATPFTIKIPYERGVFITIPPDGDVNLTYQQFEDFGGGKPGSEEPRKILEWEGAFVRDTDLSHDFQALQALRMAVRAREERVKNFKERTRNNRVSAGHAVTEDDLEAIVESSGYGKMIKEADILKARVQTLEKVVNADEGKGSVRETLDPERTCFVVNPPRQFPSKTALQMFLNENPEVAAQHNAMLHPTQEAPTQEASEFEEEE